VKSRGLTASLLALTVAGLCVVVAVSAAHTRGPSSTAALAAATGPAAAAETAPSLHVSGNHLVNARGQRVVLHGVDRSGGEYACVGTNGSNGWGFFDGPVNQASVTAMKKWDINAVRVPLNEACWNGESYVNPSYRGTLYRKAVEGFVRLLNRNGLVVILDLHWTDGAYTGPGTSCTTSRAECQKPMPDTAESVPFWRSVAATFKDDDSVIFDLFNEPFPESAPGATETEAWHCWRYGGHCTGISYSVAGMQTLVDTVRATGAKNVIMLGGLAYSSDLSEWLTYEPTDRDHNLAASWHAYNFGGCHVSSCWNGQVAPVLKKVPLIAGEIGENDCADDYIDPLMTWLDARSASYLAWAWNADFGCGTGPGLITSYNGTPTAFGTGYRAHLLSRR
jgi:endoglucanase